MSRCAAVTSGLVGAAPPDAISASIGVAVVVPDPHQRNSPDLLMQTADKALYAAKAGGRDQVKVA
jgi:PleD family two-component response regulator